MHSSFWQAIHLSSAGCVNYEFLDTPLKVVSTSGFPQVVDFRLFQIVAYFFCLSLHHGSK